MNNMPHISLTIKTNLVIVIMEKTALFCAIAEIERLY